MNNCKDNEVQLCLIYLDNLDLFDVEIIFVIIVI